MRDESIGFEGIYFNQLNREKMKLGSDSQSSLVLDDSINDM